MLTRVQVVVAASFGLDQNWSEMEFAALVVVVAAVAAPVVVAGQVAAAGEVASFPD